MEGVNGVLIDGMAVAVKGSKCLCTGSSKPNSIKSGCSGVMIDGVPVATMGCTTEHGGTLSEGVVGVKITANSGDSEQGTAENPEARIFNLRWLKGDQWLHSDYLGEELIFKASTVGYQDGEKVKVCIYNDAHEVIIDQEAEVEQGEISIVLSVAGEHFDTREGGENGQKE